MQNNGLWNNGNGELCFHKSDAHESFAVGLRACGKLTVFSPLLPRSSCWPLGPCAVNRHGSVISQNSARASLPNAPPTSTRWTALPVRAARPTATMACASPTRSSASSCGGLVRTLLQRMSLLLPHHFQASLPLHALSIA